MLVKDALEQGLSLPSWREATTGLSFQPGVPKKICTLSISDRVLRRRS
jgi:hypothetical protein